MINANIDSNLNVTMINGPGNGLVGCPFIVKDKNDVYHLKWKNLSSSVVDKMSGKS
jgi:hypothetical protein